MHYKCKFVRPWLVIILIGSLFGCNDYKQRVAVGRNLNYTLPDEVSNIKYFQISRTADYERPYNIFIKFEIDLPGFHKIIEDLNLINGKTDFNEKMCLDGVNNFYVNHFWDFDHGTFGVQNVSWWDVNTFENELLFGSFYKVDGKKKIESCYHRDWDGKILATYNRITRNAYIYISVLMK